MVAGITALAIVIVIHIFMFALCKAASDRRDDD